MATTEPTASVAAAREARARDAAEGYIDTIRIAVEICCGLAWGDPRSRVPQDDGHRIVWHRIAAEVDAMAAAGIAIDIPFD